MVEYVTRVYTSDVELARAAASGQDTARSEISRRIDRIIRQASIELCKKYCREHRFTYICTLDDNWGLGSAEAVLCEWGNGSYAWMLDDLARDERLMKFEGKGDATLEAYWSTIVRSNAFVQRWQAWRFGGRLRAPEYIKKLDPDAGKLFFMLRDQQPLAMAVQSLGREPADIEQLASRIVIELTKRKQLKLLDKDMTLSMTGMQAGSDDEAEADTEYQVPIQDRDAAESELEGMIRAGWSGLDAVEQFVLTAMIVDKMKAKQVLAELQQQGLELPGKGGKNAEKSDKQREQQLFYFTRKCLEKLRKQAGLDEISKKPGPGVG